MSTSTDQPGTLRDELAHALADLADAYDGDETTTWHDTAEALIGRPPYGTYSTTPGRALHDLWSDFPLQTPFGEVHVTIYSAEAESRTVDLRAPRGGSFIVNGKQYAPADRGHLEYLTITASLETSYDGKRSAWQVRTSAWDGLTPAAATKVAEWIATPEAQAAIWTPERVAAREVYDAAIAAHHAREKRDELAAQLTIAEADAALLARRNHEALAAAVRLALGEEAI